MNTTATSRAIRVLLLEDDKDDLFATKRMLAAESAPGFVVTHAGSVAEAEVRLRTELPDVVLTDLCVPDSEGLPTFLSLHRAAPGVPVVVLSGIVDEQTALAAVRAGAQDYLIKSTVESTLLNRTLHHAIERHRADVALRESEQRFLLAVNGSNDGLWDWRLDGGLYLSPRWRTMLEYADGEEESSSQIAASGRSPSKNARLGYQSSDPEVYQDMIDAMPTRQPELGKSRPATWEGVEFRLGNYLAAPVYSWYNFGEMENKRRTGFKQLRRILDPGAKHCLDCIAWSEDGWQPMGMLPAPGERCQCLFNCRCSLEYR